MQLAVGKYPIYDVVISDNTFWLAVWYTNWILGYWPRWRGA
jgi:hypothetical protein